MATNGEYSSAKKGKKKTKDAKRSTKSPPSASKPPLSTELVNDSDLESQDANEDVTQTQSLDEEPNDGHVEEADAPASVPQLEPRVPALSGLDSSILPPAESNGTHQFSSSGDIRPTKPFVPPEGFKPIEKLPRSTAATEQLSSEALKGKQLFYICAPADLKVENLQELSWKSITKGDGVFKQDGATYGITIDEENQRKGLSVYIPTREGYRPVHAKVHQVMAIQQQAALPKLKRAAAVEVVDDDVRPTAKKPKKEQPKGLRMRFKPIGYGPGDPGLVGEDLHADVKMADAQNTMPSSVPAMVPATMRASPVDYKPSFPPEPSMPAAESGEKKKKKKKKKDKERGKAASGGAEMSPVAIKQEMDIDMADAPSATVDSAPPPPPAEISAVDVQPPVSVATTPTTVPTVDGDGKKKKKKKDKHRSGDKDKAFTIKTEDVKPEASGALTLSSIPEKPKKKKKKSKSAEVAPS